MKEKELNLEKVINGRVEVNLDNYITIEKTYRDINETTITLPEFIYDYEIDAKTGKILKAEKDLDD